MVLIADDRRFIVMYGFMGADDRAVLSFAVNQVIESFKCE